MDDKTQLLICLASAVAANCVPCFDHYYCKAQETGLSDGEVKQAVALGGKVKQGGAMAMTNGVREIMGGQGKSETCCPDSAPAACCG